jgi:DNA-binding CsgD family transcriptional regulator
LIAHDQLSRTEFFNDFAAKHETSRMMTAALRRDGARTSLVSLLRSEEAGAFSASQARLFRALVPHLQRAARLRALLDEAGARSGCLAEALDRMAMGVLLLRADLSVAHANRAARAILDARDGLSWDHGVLRASTPTLTNALRDLCRASIAVEAPAESPAMLLDRPSGRSALQVMVSRLTRAIGDACPETAVIVVFLRDPDLNPSGRAQLLRRYYALTSREAVFASRLATGCSLHEIAQDLSLTLETARWYRKRILSKAGCRTQTALVRELTRALGQDGLS